ncbi:hypothetical protein BDP27DRAFT_1353058 [Rhodocollybia butyracea]|uniref:Uncharacterized protein n=1 Tax=Rhodocollybia butyracea TaxID=206335 RepID=A0A9P5P650_9AGAR|nr:hypothetical protein BDP27DRAFT_1353058 [Rhodocollybia butyracea]
MFSFGVSGTLSYFRDPRLVHSLSSYGFFCQSGLPFPTGFVPILASVPSVNSAFSVALEVIPFKGPPGVDIVLGLDYVNFCHCANYDWLLSSVPLTSLGQPHPSIVLPSCLEVSQCFAVDLLVGLRHLSSSLYLLWNSLLTLLLSMEHSLSL